MTGESSTSVFAILSWLKEQPSTAFKSLDEAAARFGMTPEQMRRNLQWLQRHECVKRGGRDNAEWSITELGLVRLDSGRFSTDGGFVSTFDTNRSALNTL